MNLYEINKMLQSVLDDNVDPETGEILDTIDFEVIEALELQRDIKVENLALWWRNLTAEVAMLKAEEARLNTIRTRKTKQADRIKQYLSDTLQGEKFNRNTVDIRFTSSTSVVVDPHAELDERYYKQAKPTVDKFFLKQVLSAGEQIAGAKLVTKKNIQIK